MITSSKLYNYIQCRHRVWRDEHGPKDEMRNEINPFVELLWNRGVQHKKDVIKTLGDFLDLSDGSLNDREQKTSQAILNKEKIIYQGVIKENDLLGIPDLLVLEDNIYYPIDIKSGIGTEDTNLEKTVEAKLKKEYALPLSLYIDILNRKGIINHKTGFIIDINSDRIHYDLEIFWGFYVSTLETVRKLISNNVQNDPALCSSCKLCGWYSSCKSWAEEKNDLTLLYRIGRNVRDIISKDLRISSINELINLSVSELVEKKKADKTFLKGLGQKTLKALKLRSNMYQNNLNPIIHKKIRFPEVSHELFFDIEDDPTQGFVYMHGIYQRSGRNEKFLHFTANDISSSEEKKAWSDFWNHIKGLPKNDYAVYYYSHHEKTTYKKLQKKYPDVITQEEVVAFFENPNVIDLFKYVASSTDWPLGSYSLKDLATYLGFSWRDRTPSGALSIKWFNDYLETKNKETMQRILEYNEDDCKATMVIKDGLQQLMKNNSI